MYDEKLNIGNMLLGLDQYSPQKKRTRTDESMTVYRSAKSSRLKRQKSRTNLHECPITLKVDAIHTKTELPAIK